MRLKWKTDIEKSVVVMTLERRGWQRVHDDDGPSSYAVTSSGGTASTAAAARQRTR